MLLVPRGSVKCAGLVALKKEGEAFNIVKNDLSDIHKRKHKWPLNAYRNNQTNIFKYILK